MEEKKISLALFDFDGTMIRGDSIVPYLAFARRRGDVSLFGYLKGCLFGAMFALKIIDGEEAKRKALSFYQHLPPEKRQALDRSFAEENLLPRVYPKAKETLQMHQKAGQHTLLVSASTENYMQYVAKALFFDALLSTKMDEQGRVKTNCHGEEKVRRIRAYLSEQKIQPDFSQSFAYGDSKGDLPMLSLCGHPVQINGKRKLHKAAPDMEKEKWSSD